MESTKHFGIRVMRILLMLCCCERLTQRRCFLVRAFVSSVHLQEYSSSSIPQSPFHQHSSRAEVQQHTALAYLSSQQPLALPLHQRQPPLKTAQG